MCIRDSSDTSLFTNSQILNMPKLLTGKDHKETDKSFFFVTEKELPSIEGSSYL